MTKFKHELNMYILKDKDGWYHGASSPTTACGWDAPQGPFKTFKEAMNSFREASHLDFIAESFAEDEELV